MSSQPSGSLKRKDSDHPNESPVTAKKAKSASEANVAAAATAEDAPKPFTNMTIPVIIKLPEPTPNTVKICSWNVAGLRAAQKKVRPVLLRGPFQPLHSKMISRALNLTSKQRCLTF